MSYYTLQANYNGKSHALSYYSDGWESDYPGHVTSVRQVRSALSNVHKKIPTFNLIYISSKGEPKKIENDYHLDEAFEALENGSSLAVNVVAVPPKKNNKGDKNNNKANNKKKKTPKPSTGSSDDSSGAEGQYESASEPEPTGCDSDADAPAGIKKNGKGKGRGAGNKKKGDKGDKKKPNAAAILKRFHKHTDTPCWHCKKASYSGARYTYYSDSDYSLCMECHADLSKAAKDDWVYAGPPYKGAPKAPLARDDMHSVSSDVKHLQYILTITGYMPLDATSQLVGSFQSHTEKAIQRLRSDNNNKDGENKNNNSIIYDKKCEAKLNEVVKKMRDGGNMFV